MTKEIVLMNGFGSIAKTAFVVVKTSGDQIQFSTETGFGTLFTDKLKTDNGQTVGERNRANLHAMLDAWIDKEEWAQQ